MRKAVIAVSVSALLVGGANFAAAQTSAQGRAFGTRLDLLGSNIVDQSDTQLRTAPNASNTPTIDATAAGATIDIAPIAQVITGPSTVRGCSTAGGCPNLFSTPGPTPLAANLDNEVFVESDAGDATASVLVGQGPGSVNVLDAVSSGATATARCNNDALGTAKAEFDATSHVDALVIAGTRIPLPGEQPPNTTIVAAQLPLLILNEQRPEDCFLTATSAQCTVTALHAQAVPTPLSLNVVDLKLSSATAKITFDSSCVCNGAMLVSSKVPHVLTSGGVDEVPPNPNPGDTIKYVIRVTNSGCVAANGVTVIDRIPNGVTVDPARLPTGATLGACSVPITRCGTSSSSQCLTIPVGTIAVNQSVEKDFFVTVNNDAGCNSSGVGFPICNAYSLQGDGAPTTEPGPGIVLCPNGQPTPAGGTSTPGPTATPRPGSTSTPIVTTTPGSGSSGAGTGFLETTGSGGGCSLGGNAARGGSELAPIVLLAAWLLRRRGRPGPRSTEHPS